MKTQGLNLFIVDDNKSMVNALKQYLQSRFGVSLKISTFYDGESCLEKVDEDTHIVILDYQMTGKNGIEVLKLIKAINPKTEVIMLSSNNDIVLAIDSFRMGAADYVVKGTSSWRKITQLVNEIITDPIRRMVKEFRVSKFFSIFLLTFAIMAIVVAWALNYLI